ncbi:hypothetical protein [Streptomyces sp. NPDC058092]|uniref:hypothetical protein n=1 Tax=Streptomyces sp. NPDC058092 TaxID=3346336 RepID=UPI0036E2282D
MTEHALSATHALRGHLSPELRQSFPGCVVDLGQGVTTSSVDALQLMRKSLGACLVYGLGEQLCSAAGISAEKTDHKPPGDEATFLCYRPTTTLTRRQQTTASGTGHNWSMCSERQ